MGMKVFITGAGGYLGRVLATQLAAIPDIDSITGTINKAIPRFPFLDNRGEEYLRYFISTHAKMVFAKILETFFAQKQ